MRTEQGAEQRAKQEAERMAVERFSQMSLLRLRTYQSIIEKQTKLAFEQHKTCGLVRMQGMSCILAAAIDLQVFGIESTIDPELVAQQITPNDFNDLII